MKDAFLFRIKGQPARKNHSPGHIHCLKNTNHWFLPP